MRRWPRAIERWEVVETDPRDNRPIEPKREPEVNREALEDIQKGAIHADAIQSPAGKVFIENTLAELEKAFNALITVDTTRPDLSINFFIGLIMKCQTHIEILKRFGLIIDYGHKLAERQVGRALRSK